MTLVSRLSCSMRASCVAALVVYLVVDVAGVGVVAPVGVAPSTPLSHATVGSIIVVKDADLFKSEPDPRRFGNAANPPNDAALLRKHGWSNWNWLLSRFHFSFAEHRSGRPSFGPLRVANDDLIQPQRGFGTHSHSNVEIVTYVIEGALTHRDSMGTSETLTDGDVQFMTAGTGVRHSEHNLSEDKPLRLIQMWFNTRRRNLTPNYGSSKGDRRRRHNQWHHIVTDVARSELEDGASTTAVVESLKDVDDDDGGDDSAAGLPPALPIGINQDVDMFVTELDKQKSLPYTVEVGRQAYVICLNGSDVALVADGGGPSVSMHDAAMVTGGTALVLQTNANAGASVLVIDVPA